MERRGGEKARKKDRKLKFHCIGHMTTNPKLGLSSIEIRCMDTEQSCIVSTTRSSSSHPRKPFWLTTFPPFLLKKTVSELFSTFLLVFVTCGAAALHRSSQDMRVSQLGSSAAGGLIVTVMIYSVGHISGAHMNPAVTLAFAASKHVHFPWIQVPFYWSAQLSGAILASFVLKALLYPITDMGTTTLQELLFKRSSWRPWSPSA
ncbi:hypothetical protein HPP92_016224 [Vanilla planifolia]|uniref:Uncharacterized protein n=1 Tax=Vanilla planifolia TaxID=51239 RepID=A0A835QIA5_VANPL|nr:hypothetical protein HPP92_016829 [Vanilla planifolia]KAG0471678.1 hypothetical protein HPP92_016224 [Vanilla planifolia]